MDLLDEAKQRVKKTIADRRSERGEDISQEAPSRPTAPIEPAPHLGSCLKHCMPAPTQALGRLIKGFRVDSQVISLPPAGVCLMSTCE